MTKTSVKKFRRKSRSQPAKKPNRNGTKNVRNRNQRRQSRRRPGRSFVTSRDAGKFKEDVAWSIDLGNLDRTQTALARRTTWKSAIDAHRSQQADTRWNTETTYIRGGDDQNRSPVLTVFWHCGFTRFSSRTGLGARARQQTVNGFGRGCGSKGSGNADSQLFIRSSGWSGQCRPRPGDSGCVAAHPADRRAASYLPLRAGWAGW